MKKAIALFSLLASNFNLWSQNIKARAIGCDGIVYEIYDNQTWKIESAVSSVSSEETNRKKSCTNDKLYYCTKILIAFYFNVI